MKKRDNGMIRCQCLDFVEATHRHRVYPLMYCHLELLGHLDADRLKQSVALSSQVVPEILCAYDFKRSGFVHAGYTADDVVKYVAKRPVSLLRQDLSCHPQLQILITPKEDRDFIIVIMSHILADGQGFLQYLYLLAALYNGQKPDKDMKNLRDVSPLSENIRVLAPTEQTRHHRSVCMSPLRSGKTGGQLFCLTSQISADSMTLLRQKASSTGATLNHVFLTAYARVIARLQNITTVVLPCPADLRRFHPEQNALTVANMTGIYRKVAIEIPSGCPFTTSLQQVQIEMELQKSRHRCFEGINTLSRVFHHAAPPLLEQVIKATYRLPSVSYTNWGSIQHKKLCFKGCTIQNCFLTGTYRLPPDFQLTVSTFNNQCTLNCTLIGSPDDRKKGQSILEQVKCEILKWIENR